MCMLCMVDNFDLAVCYSIHVHLSSPLWLLHQGGPVVHPLSTCFVSCLCLTECRVFLPDCEQGFLCVLCAGFFCLTVSQGFSVCSVCRVFCLTVNRGFLCVLCAGFFCLTVFQEFSVCRVFLSDCVSGFSVCSVCKIFLSDCTGFSTV